MTELHEVRRWVAAIGSRNLDTGRRITKRDVLAVIDEAGTVTDPPVTEAERLLLQWGYGAGPRVVFLAELRAYRAEAYQRGRADAIADAEVRS